MFVTRHRGRSTVQALELIGALVTEGRRSRQWTTKELAERVGVSQPTILKVEKGDPGVAVGTVFEAALLTGVPLFGDEADRVREADRVGGRLALLPQSVRRRRVEDDF